MDPRDEQSIQAARLYHEGGLSQEAVASRLGVSRPTVSKLLAHARERGFVTITIHDPREASTELADALKERFSLEEVRVTTTGHSEAAALDAVGEAGAALLAGAVHDGDLLGVCWGRAVNAVARAMPPQERTGVGVVQLKGGHSHTAYSTDDDETLARLGEAYGARPVGLPLPVIFDDVRTKRIVEQDRHIRGVLERGAAAQVAVFTIGAVGPHATLLNLGYLTDAEQAHVRDVAVGDLVSRFLDAQGRVCLPELDERTVGITLEQLRAKRARLLVAAGARKATPLAVVLAQGYATHLAVDLDLARAVLGTVEAPDATVARATASNRA